jgi:hypothetical protein
MLKNDFTRAVWINFRLSITRFWAWLADQIFLKIILGKEIRRFQRIELRNLREKLGKEEFKIFKRKFRKSNVAEREKMLLQMNRKFPDLPFHYVAQTFSPTMDGVNDVAGCIADFEEMSET